MQKLYEKLYLCKEKILHEHENKRTTTTKRRRHGARAKSNTQFSLVIVSHGLQNTYIFLCIFSQHQAMISFSNFSSPFFISKWSFCTFAFSFLFGLSLPIVTLVAFQSFFFFFDSLLVILFYSCRLDPGSGWLCNRPAVNIHDFLLLTVTIHDNILSHSVNYNVQCDTSVFASCSVRIISDLLIWFVLMGSARVYWCLNVRERREKWFNNRIYMYIEGDTVCWRHIGHCSLLLLSIAIEVFRKRIFRLRATCCRFRKIHMYAIKYAMRKGRKTETESITVDAFQ